MRYTSVVLGLLCCPVLAYAQGTRLLRQPTVSNTQIAFAYAGDIWVASRDGGDAKRLTSFPGTESNPHFSPDGKQIAFSMQYGGNTDVYVIDAAGGEAQRLTWHPSPDIARGWSPDAKRIVFSSARASAPSVGVQSCWTPTDGALTRAELNKIRFASGDQPRAMSGDGCHVKRRASPPSASIT